MNSPTRRSNAVLGALVASLLGVLAAPDIPSVSLGSGVRLPMALWGSGGATQENATSTEAAVAVAVSGGVGFPGVDCANHYHNQDGVARGIARSGTSRGSVWLTTKVEPCNNGGFITPVRPGHCHNDTLAAVAQNLRQLGTDTVDLTLLHSPPCLLNASWDDGRCYWPDQPDAVYPQGANCSAPQACAMMRAQWRALEAALLAGRTRAIGVSNFCPACLECLASDPARRVPPAVNQVQFHLGMPGGADPAGLLSYCRRRGIVVQAYSPLGSSDDVTKLLGSPVVQRVAKAHNRSAAQVCLRWVAQLGVPFATSTVNAQFMREDLDVFAWTLTVEEMQQLSALRLTPDADPVKGMCLL